MNVYPNHHIMQYHSFRYYCCAKAALSSHNSMTATCGAYSLAVNNGIVFG